MMIMEIFRRDFLKGLVAIPFLGLFSIGSKKNINKELEKKIIDYNKRLNIDRLDAPFEK